MSATRHDIQPKILQYEAFLNETLKPDLQRANDATARLEAEVAEYDALEANLRMLKERDGEGKAAGGSLKMQVDLGCEVLCQAHVPDTSRVFISIGLGFHLECTLDEAPRVIQLRRKGTQDKAEASRRQSAKIRAHIRLVEEGLRELMHLS